MTIDAACNSPPLLPSPMADYQLKIPGLDHAKVATAMAGLVGTLVVFGVSWGMARVLPAPKREGATPRCGLTGWNVIAHGYEPTRTGSTRGSS